MCKHLFVSLAVSLLFLSNTYAQERPCPDVPGETSATYRFRRLGEVAEIKIRGEGTDPDCEPVALTLHWNNGRNNGSNFSVIFLDAGNRPVSAKQISAFMTGVLQLSLSSPDAQPVYGASMQLISVPTTIRIQSVSPFAAPALLSYSIERISRAKPKKEEKESPPNYTDGNEVVSIRDTVRVIGASRLPVVQVDLTTIHPFPVTDARLQLLIGKKVFVQELSGDYTGSKLTLSLTPEMYKELNDGDEIIAFFANPNASDASSPTQTSASTGENESAASASPIGARWYFGKLRKTMKQEGTEGRRQEQ